MKIGDSVYTIRFCTVWISTIFENEAEAHTAGFCEPAYYKDDYIILGKLSERESLQYGIPSRFSY